MVEVNISCSLSKVAPSTVFTVYWAVVQLPGKKLEHASLVGFMIWQTFHAFAQSSEQKNARPSATNRIFSLCSSFNF